uniref:SMP-LTD domain-containing protein n=1 Tax=Angiostrongylus cantonensis TaxID=6313 RepID=A0A0K0CWU3_ANGCA
MPSFPLYVAGHVTRINDNRWTRAVSDWIPPDVKRTAGRPPTRWSEFFTKSLEERYGARRVPSSSRTHRATLVCDKEKWIYWRRSSHSTVNGTTGDSSVSMHPVGTAPECLPSLAAERLSSFDDGYTAETDSNDESEPDLTRMSRANSLSDIDDFISVPVGAPSSHKRRSLYLFVRAAREKERWFHLLREACAQSKGFGRPKTRRRNSEVRFALDCPSISDTLFEDALYKRVHAQFATQISLILGCGVPQPERGSTVSVDLGTVKWKRGIPEENSDLVESINSLGTRIFFDFCRDEFWANQVKHKIQSKLATIHLPYFIEELELSSLSLGTTAPQIIGVYAPKLNDWGIWVDLEMKYAGGIRLVLQTSVNLLKLQYGAAKVEAERKLCRLTDAMARTFSHYSDEELPESPESSPDEDFGAKNNFESTSTRERTGKKIISMVERAAQSSFFQKAAKLPKVAK